MTVLFLVHVITTVMVAGMMWFVQVVHYPLLPHVGHGSFVSYEKAHTRLAIATVVPLMVIETVTGGLLVLWRPRGVGLVPCWIGLVLLAIIWWSTFRLQVPQHRILSRGFDDDASRRLVRSNWIRTGSYSVRILVMLWMLTGILRG